MGRTSIRIQRRSSSALPHPCLFPNIPLFQDGPALTCADLTHVPKLVLSPLQAATVRPTANGTAAPHTSQAAKPSPGMSAAHPTPTRDPSDAISLAVTQINSGRVDEAEKLLSSIISETDKRTPNLGAHVARGTARALRRELQGTVCDMICHSPSLPGLHKHAHNFQLGGRTHCLRDGWSSVQICAHSTIHSLPVFTSACYPTTPSLLLDSGLLLHF